MNMFGASFLRRMVVPTDFLATFQRGTKGMRPARADSAILEGKRIGHGNQVSWADNKHRRMWKPNIQKKRFWSDSFDCMLKLTVTTTVIKNIDKAGGLDSYLMKKTDSQLDSDLGSDLKKLVAEQRRRLAAGEEPLPLPRIARPPRGPTVHGHVEP